MNETWKPIKNYDGLYEISNLGRIKRLIGYRCRMERIIAPCLDGQGYFYVSLSKNNKRKNHKVHRLVLENFICKCPEGMEGCHNDGNKTNNKLNNLRFDTHKNNELDKIFHGTDNNGERCGTSKLNNWQVRIIKKLIGELTQQEISEIFNIHRVQISKIKNNKQWKYSNV